MRKSRLSPATAISAFALVFALTGTGLAAKSYVISSSRQIKDGAVTGADVKNGSLSGADVKDRSLTSADFSGSLQGSQGPQGPQGAQGPEGLRGPVGPTQGGSQGGADPAANPDGYVLGPGVEPTDGSYLRQEVSMTSAGRLMAMAHIDGLRVDCSSGAPRLGLYVDGTPVPGSARDVLAYEPLDTFGVTSSVLPAGPHVLAVWLDCPSGTLTGGQFSYEPRQLGYVVLGG